MTTYTNKYDDKTEEEKKVIALAMHLCDGLYDDLTEEEKEEKMEEAREAIDDGDYEVFTDMEADNRLEEELDNYLQECIYPDLPENMRYYFDDNSWKSDARYDGRGHCISRYDGEEHYEEVDRVTYYIYRQN